MLEQYLINHCAPTLASLKTANLFNCTAENPTALQMAVSRWQALLAPKGVELLLLRESGNRALVYVYRPDRLARDLQQPGVSAFLAHCGYTGTAPAACLEVLRRKLAVSSDFPHEIGLFLGYPLGDVIGFIENHGQNCLCSGVWIPTRRLPPVHFENSANAPAYIAVCSLAGSGMWNSLQ